MVIRGDSRDRGGEFQHQMLIGYVSHLFVVIIVLWFEKNLKQWVGGNCLYDEHQIQIHWCVMFLSSVNKILNRWAKMVYKKGRLIWYLIYLAKGMSWSYIMRCAKSRHKEDWKRLCKQSNDVKSQLQTSQRCENANKST